MSLLSRLFPRLFPPDPAARGEMLAARHLKQKGYRILATNLRNAAGEIDILAEAPDRRTIVVVEVKSSIPGSKDTNPRPEVRVNLHKQKQLTALAVQMARRYKLTDRPIRFDVIGVDMHADGRVDIRHHEHAFESRV